MNAQSSMRALVVVAHGSRRAASNDEVRGVALSIAQRSGKRFHRVQAAFLELAEPSIPEGIMQCLRDGAAEVVVLPYFLSAGRHVAEDIPEQVAIAKHHYPQANITIAPYLGSSDAIADLMLALVPAAMNQE